MSNTIIARGVDGFYHPTSEDEVIALVNHARATKVRVRARGATHSVAWSIYTDPVAGLPLDKTLEASPPAGANIDIALDQLARLTWLDEAAGTVEVGAGIHMGFDPSDPFGVSTIANSLLYQAFLKGWAVNIVGGITHQTISGFTGTGSAGGSITYAFDNVAAFRVVDGLGAASWIARGDDAFDAMLTAVGLMGVVTAVRLQLVPMYLVTGQEATTPVTGPECPVDLFGPGDADRLSLAKFLKDQPYSRLTWWPQKGCERVQIWQAARAPVPPGDPTLVPYQEFTPDLGGQVKQLLASVFFVLLGNTDVAQIDALVAARVTQFGHNLAGLWATRNGGAGAAATAVTIATTVLALPVQLLARTGAMRTLFPSLLPLFNPMSGSTPTLFNDYYWRSLCMDNTADDIMLGTEFIEIWLPIQYTQQVMTLFKAMFDANGSAATGYYAQEIYAAAPSTAWLNPSYSDGKDEYRDGVARFDVYWYRDNAGEPDVKNAFFEQYWDLLKANDIPFRFHWGKFIPFYDLPGWAAFYRASLPRFDDFLALRARRDPDNLFFTTYWQERLLGTAV
ncbi:FAD-binding protein [Polymorphobacter megasporae]|uniref:FAD-binding protein n=1 Tax=Glacieibacterium megasporae TaxID=2835787 RepID=UPI001C1E3DD9|nr:FAD-binding protein [Polymorphobacter megasporae]UAJ08884.1 FAD-binding protein [Polymorphobacter megasporae]